MNHKLYYILSFKEIKKNTIIINNHDDTVTRSKDMVNNLFRRTGKMVRRRKDKNYNQEKTRIEIPK